MTMEARAGAWESPGSLRESKSLTSRFAAVGLLFTTPLVKLRRPPRSSARCGDRPNSPGVPLADSAAPTASYEAGRVVDALAVRLVIQVGLLPWLHAETQAVLFDVAAMLSYLLHLGHTLAGSRSGSTHQCSRGAQRCHLGHTLVAPCSV